MPGMQDWGASQHFLPATAAAVQPLDTGTAAAVLAPGFFCLFVSQGLRAQLVLGLQERVVWPSEAKAVGRSSHGNYSQRCKHSQKAPRASNQHPKHSGTRASHLMFPTKAEITLFLFCPLLPEFPACFHLRCEMLLAFLNRNPLFASHSYGLLCFIPAGL